MIHHRDTELTEKTWSEMKLKQFLNAERKYTPHISYS
jgi:hypothetical protein